MPSTKRSAGQRVSFSSLVWAPRLQEVYVKQFLSASLFEGAFARTRIHTALPEPTRPNPPISSFGSNEQITIQPLQAGAGCEISHPCALTVERYGCVTYLRHCWSETRTNGDCCCCC